MAEQEIWKDQLIAKWRYANENDENARRLITNDETMCVNEANELREMTQTVH